MRFRPTTLSLALVAAAVGCSDDGALVVVGADAPPVTTVIDAPRPDAGTPVDQTPDAQAIDAPPTACTSLGLTALDVDSTDGVSYTISSGKLATWDGVLVDVDVTVPRGGHDQGPLPLIVLLHGLGGTKASFESPTATSTDPQLNHYNNVWFASRGYAVLTYSARGHGDTCSLLDLLCLNGYAHVADRRFEVRDAKYLAGVLADGCVAQPQKVAISGLSYGGGQTILAAVEGDRVTVPNPDATLALDPENDVVVPWLSPNGKAMHLAVALPRYGWSDLLNSLFPNGRAADGLLLPDGDRTTTIGIEKLSYNTFLLGILTTAGGKPSIPTTDPTADVLLWYLSVTVGEPYILPQVYQVQHEFNAWHSAVTATDLIQSDADRGDEVPLFIIQGWTDQLFPALEGISLVNKLHAIDPKWPIAINLADVGHPAAQNKASDWDGLNTAANKFLDHYMLDKSDIPDLRATANVTTCGDDPPGTSYAAANYASLATDKVVFTSDALHLTLSLPTDVADGTLSDPLVAFAESTLGLVTCTTTIVPANGLVDAVYEFPTTKDFTMMGLPALHLDVTMQLGNDATVLARLWDVAPNGTRTLVTRGGYRLVGNGVVQQSVDTELTGNAWTFKAGHIVQLQVTQNDVPYFKLDNEPSTLLYTNMSLTVPTAP